MKMQVTAIKGFSLVELITVVILLGVIGMVAIGRISDLSGFERRGFFDDTVAALRYAQRLANSTGCSVQVTLTASSYLLQQESICGSAVFNRNVLSPLERNNTYEATAPPSVNHREARADPKKSVVGGCVTRVPRRSWGSSLTSLLDPGRAERQGPLSRRYSARGTAFEG